MLKGPAVFVLIAAFLFVWNLGVRSGTASAQSIGRKFPYLEYNSNLPAPFRAQANVLDWRNGDVWNCHFDGCKFIGHLPLEQVVENPSK